MTTTEADDLRTRPMAAVRSVDALSPHGTTKQGPAHSHRPGRAVHSPRLDIQGMRAVAVGLVVLYHLRPDKLSGGFIGVDVFFVLSGYLIVGSLGREAARTGSISLSGFYTRRIRRLLPASSVVLLVVMAATALLMPLSRWQATAEQLVTSALQVQNWELALGTGYAAATEAVSPLQHYWSLAVEEQFYLVAPLLLIALSKLAGRLGRSRMTVIVAGMAVLTVASLVHSVLFTTSNHDVAYFASTTRMWELTMGGLLALVGSRLRLGTFTRSALGLVGLLAVLGSAVRYTTAMAFPGWIALVPVLGTVLLIAAGTPAGNSDEDEVRPGVVSRLLSTKPFTFVGDISYSLYLWHWPVIVFYGFYIQRVPTKVECLVLIVGSLVIAQLSTRFIEGPFREPRSTGTRRRSPRARSTRGAFRLAAVLVTASVVAGVLPWLYVNHRMGQLDSQLLDADHPGGAKTLAAQLHTDPSIAVVPDPAVADQDHPLVDDKDCSVYDPRKMKPDACVFGDPSSDFTMVLTGDSHAGQFSTPLSAIAEAQGWRLLSMTRNGCPFGSSPSIWPNRTDVDCTDANVMTRDQILKVHPRVMVTTAMNPMGYEASHGWHWKSFDDQVQGYRDLWAPLVQAGIQVVVIRDTPVPTYVDPECVERNGRDSTTCSITRAAADDQRDPAVAAAREMDGVHVIDLTDHFCNTEICPGVVGNVLVYRDNHVTDTFARSLTPALMSALDAVV